jgi:hypothetical protein
LARTIGVTSFAVAATVGGGLMLWQSSDEFWLLPVVAGLVLGIIHWLGPALATRRYWKGSTNIHGRNEIELDKHGYTVTFPNGHIHVAWSGLTKWRETEQLFLLYTHPQIAQILPKHFFASDSDVGLARQLIAQHLPKER